MNRQKPDAERIAAFMDSLAGRLELDPPRSWWPGFLFHTTELRNAVDILNSGMLLSRQALGDQMPWENANRRVIDHTPPEVQRAARFYFRPRTPMTHNNEGFRTIQHRNPEAYCPVPIAIVSTRDGRTDDVIAG